MLKLPVTAKTFCGTKTAKAALPLRYISKKKPAYNCLTMPYYALLAQ